MANARNTLTVTVYDVQRVVEGRRYRSQYATTPEYFPADEYEITPLVRTFEVGQTVRVRAFGAWRIGAVTKLGRSLVTVDYYRNREGDRHVRAFAASEVMPYEEWELGNREYGRLPGKGNPAAVAKLTAERQAAAEAEADRANRLEYSGREGTGLCPSQVSGRHCWDRNDPTYCLACHEVIG